MASIIVYIYAALMMIGGIGGFAMKGSIWSLVTGIISGLALITAGRAMASGKSYGLPVALTVIVALLLFFSSRYFGSPEHNFMPGGMNALLSLITLIAVLVTSRGRS